MIVEKIKTTRKERQLSCRETNKFQTLGQK